MGRINVPEFPGQKYGDSKFSKESIEKIRSFIKRQKRMKGFRFTVPTGGAEFDLPLSGTARVFLGFAFYGIPDVLVNENGNWTNFFQVGSVQFTINNEIIIDQTSVNFYTAQFTDEEYYYMPRPLTGQDTIKMAFTNPGISSEVVDCVMYYL